MAIERNTRPLPFDERILPPKKVIQFVTKGFLECSTETKETTEHPETNRRKATWGRDEKLT